MRIRAEYPLDRQAVFELNALAFGREGEAKLVDALREGGHFEPGMSLVAEIDARVVGHLLFSWIELDSSRGALSAAALASLCVDPQFQRRGIGAALLKEGLARMKSIDCQAVLVVGDSAYYRRFGFSAELAKRISCPYSGPRLLGLELERGTLAGAGLRAVYPEPFTAL